ncbi:hypothetical protein Bhyg_01929 [Pseudolycoriella hygida]|uniref:Uncharacterized protein n=1 Tax=Pseudolycoriella hygida TaxID=35572 RepID=A0A9Q0NBP7_9DIPT|nr:hypothetical protein Bhyg_01929 [Pseudolycoriella hygida]
MGGVERKCTSESDDEIRYKAWDANDDPCAVKYRKENHVYRLLGEVTNAGHLLNFKVLHLSRAVSYLHTNSNGQFFIPPSLENADLQYLHQNYFRHCMESERYLGQLRRALDGNSGVISHTPGGYSGMYLNPHSSSNSQYFGGLGIIPGIWPSPRGYNGMLVNPTHSANSQYSGGFERIPGSSPTPGGYHGMLVNPAHLANSQYLGCFERIPGSSPTPTLGWGETISYRPFLTNLKPLGGATETVGRSTNEIDLPEAKGQRRNSKDSDQFRPHEGSVSSFSGSLGRTADMSFSPGSYDGLLSHPLDSTNPTPIRDQGGSDSGQFPSSSASSSFVCVRGSEEFPSLSGDGKMLSYPNDLTNPKPLGGAAETVGRFTNEIDLP